MPLLSELKSTILYAVLLTYVTYSLQYDLDFNYMHFIIVVSKFTANLTNTHR